MGKYVWSERELSGRNLIALFRHAFTLDTEVKEAEIEIFAASSYQLFVNGSLVCYGPARFDPREPEYDVVDISGYLQVGRNALAVRVKAHNYETFLSLPCGAAFYCEGEVRTSKGSISLFTPGDWRALRVRQSENFAPMQSFALPAAELFHQEEEPVGWMTAEYDSSSWQPCEVLDCPPFGELKPRSIPMLSFSDCAPEDIKVWALEGQSWAHCSRDAALGKGSFITAGSIHALRDCEADIKATSWDLIVNGLPAERVETNDQFYYRVFHVKLHQGLNTFCARFEPQDTMAYFRIASKTDGVAIQSRDNVLPCAGPFEEGFLAEHPLPWAPENGRLTCAPCTALPATACGLDALLPRTAPAVIKDVVFKKEDFPNGFQFRLGLDRTRLTFPRIRLEGVKGAQIDLRYSEYPDETLGVLSRHWMPVADAVFCSEDRLDWMPITPRGYRYLAITVRGISGDVKVTAVDILEIEYPVEHKGFFRCSDERLNAIWQICEATQRTNMVDAYVDTVQREQGMYIRDSIIQYHNNLATGGDQQLMARTLRLFGLSRAEDGLFRAVYPCPRYYTIPDFSLNFNVGCLDYWRQTGDTALLASLWPALRDSLSFFHRLSEEREDGLLDGDWPDRHAVHSIYGGFHGDNTASHKYYTSHGINCTFTCFYIWALKATAKIGELSGDFGEATKLLERAEQLAHSADKAFWDDVPGCYRDNLTEDFHSAQANALAVLAGIVPEHKLPALRSFFGGLRSPFADGDNPEGAVLVSPHFSFYVLEALYLLDLPETAEAYIRSGWGWVLDRGLPTTPEFFELTGSSLCHAWSASPMYYLSKKALGIEFPHAPDLSKVRIRVQSALPGAQGAWPHPAGLIEVSWHRENGNILFDKLVLPEGITLLNE